MARPKKVRSEFASGVSPATVSSDLRWRLSQIKGDSGSPALSEAALAEAELFVVAWDWAHFELSADAINGMGYTTERTADGATRLVPLCP